MQYQNNRLQREQKKFIISVEMVRGMPMEVLKTKTIMTRSNQGNRWFGIDYHMNLYKGCPFGCIYCDSRCETYRIDNFDEVRIKENSLEILEEELKSKGFKGVVSFGTLSDPYNPEEEKLKLTRQALELIRDYGFGVSMDTKSDLILRDLDILKEIAHNNSVIIKISITTYDDQLSKKIEPNVINSTKRFAVLKTLRENGIYAGVLMTPVLPFLTDNEDNILNMVKKSKEADAKFIYTKMGMTLRTNQREYYYNALDVLYPGLKEDYKAVYGNKHICNTLQFRHLMELFLKSCSENHILTDMDAIIKDYKKIVPQNEQMSLF